MKAFLTFLMLSLLVPFYGTAQSCFNIGFEDSSFVNWTGYTGAYNTPLSSMTPGIVPGRHTIISAFPTVPFDSLCDTLLPKVAPGSNFSVRLGNSSVGAQHEKLIYEMQVDSSNLIFVYASAIVVQDPNHTVQSQPYFQITILDTNDSVLDPTCGQIEIFADPSIPGFVLSSSFQSQWQNPLYRDWTFGGIDLTPFFGETIKVEFTTKDCNLGGHYGYAYVDAGCYPKEIVTQFCEGSTDSIRMTAPTGFDYLWNTGDTTQTLAVLPNLADSAYFVTCTSALTGCSFELSTTTEPTFYYDFGIEETSCGQATIQTSLKISRGGIDDFYWDFGDSTTLADTSNEQTPTYTYPAPGQYEVYLIAHDGLGCYSDTLRDSVNIYFPPEGDFRGDTVCIYDTVYFNNLSEVSPNVVSGYYWNFGDSSAIDTTFSPWHLYDEDSLYSATLIVWSDSLQCGDTIIRPVLVRPQPRARFSKIEPDSCIPHEVTFVNESTFEKNSTIVNNDWNFGNDDTSSLENPVYVYAEPGVFSPQLIVTDRFGCQDSVTEIDLIRVVNVPDAEFIVNSDEEHVDSALFRFTNRSQDADGYIWSYILGQGSNGLPFSDDTDPEYVFPNSGIYTINLYAYSDFGCFDTATYKIQVINDKLFMPNVITPNGDGMNDAFYFKGDHRGINNFECSIYNRWGMLIYHTTNPSFSWEGTLNGDFVSSGTYFYILEYTGFRDEEFKYQGNVQVFRD